MSIAIAMIAGYFRSYAYEVPRGVSGVKECFSGRESIE
jgi:hypothetical protein